MKQGNIIFMIDGSRNYGFDFKWLFEGTKSE